MTVRPTTAATIALAAAVLAVAAPAGGALPRDLFRYDAQASLSVTETASEVVEGANVVELSYASPLGGRVPATLVLPQSGERAGAVLWLHDADGTRTSARPEALGLAKAGVASLLVDSSWVRPPFPALVTFDARRDRALRIRSVIEARRAFDLLAQRPEVDAARLAVVGHGPGATTAAILSGLDARARTVVLTGTGAKITTLLRRLWGPLRAKERDRYLARMTPFDPLAWVRASRSRFLFQHMRRDPNFRLPELTQLSNAARRKTVKWYGTDTERGAAALRDRAAFLRATLG